MRASSLASWEPDRRGAGSLVLGYALSGYLLSVSDNGPYAIGPAMLPWVLWAAERVSRQPTPRRSVALALALALTLWSGDAQQFVIQVELGPLVLLSHGRGGARPRWVHWAVAMGLLALLAAPVLYPLWVVAQETGRSGGTVPGVLAWPFEPVRLFELLYGQPYPPRTLRPRRRSPPTSWVGTSAECRP